MCERLRYLSWWQKIILAVASLCLLAHLTVSVVRVGHKVGDYDFNRDFDDGGPNVILLAILLGGVYCIWQGRDIMGAFWLGLAIAVKITPGLVLPYFLWKGCWRAAAYTTATTVLWILLPAVWMGP